MKPLESLLRSFLDAHPEDAARAFETLDFDAALRVFRKLPPGIAATLLERLTPSLAARLVGSVEPHRAVEFVTSISPRKASALVQHLEEPTQTQLLDSLPSHVAKSLRQLAEYSLESAGAMMEPRVASLSQDLTVQQAISTIRKTPREALHYLYVTDRKGLLVGVLNMRDLLLANPRDPIEKLVRRDLVTVAATMDQEEVVDLMRQRGFLALPVVDFEGHLVGVIKHDEALLAGQQQAFEDLQKIVGAGKDERALSPLGLVIKSRLPWLCVNLFTAFLAAAVVGMFEGIIAQVAALAVLLPVVAGQGGNTGSQALAVVMRGLALREIIPGVGKRVVVKEVLGGLVNGVAVAVITAVAVFAWRISIGDSVSFCAGLALVIGLSMVVNMIAAAASGAVIPMLLRACGRDPAQSAAIFLTTVTDIVGFASFLGFAVLFSRWLL